MKNCFLIFIFIQSLQAVQILSQQFSPWFTGPLLAPSAQTVSKGHFAIEPYVYIEANLGRYNNHWYPKKIETFWTNSSQTSILFGLNNWSDIALYPTVNYNYTCGAGKWGIGDLPVALDFQLYKQGDNSADWETALLLRIQEIFPIGKYRNLDPDKKLTDVGGEGSWQTAFILVWGSLFHLGNIYFVTWRTALQYTLPAPVHVKNFNAYGGGPGTNGTVYPAQNFQFDTAIEVNLGQTWVFAMDILGSWSKKVRFKGKSASSNTLPRAIQFSLAPAIEYNWNANLGIIAGCWFSVAGKNSNQFIDAVVAINYYK